MNRFACWVFLSGWLVLGAQAQQLSEYEGLWWVGHGSGDPLQLRLYPDGSAWSDYPSNNPGSWHVEEGKVVCLWADGWKEVLILDGRVWRKFGYKPSRSLSDPPSNQSSAIRASTQSDGWFGERPR